MLYPCIMKTYTTPPEPEAVLTEAMLDAIDAEMEAIYKRKVAEIQKKYEN